MAAMPILGKHFKNSSSLEPKVQRSWVLVFLPCGFGHYDVSLARDPWLTMIYFTTRSKVFLAVFI